MGIGSLRANLRFQLLDGVAERDAWWRDYWHDSKFRELASSQPRIVRVPDPPPGLPNPVVGELRNGIQDAVDRLRTAIAKDSTNRNLSTMLAVTSKVVRGLEDLLSKSQTEPEYR